LVESKWTNENERKEIVMPRHEALDAEIGY